MFTGRVLSFSLFETAKPGDNSSAAPPLSNKPGFEGCIIPTHHLMLSLHVSLEKETALFMPLCTKTKRNLSFLAVIEFREKFQLGDLPVQLENPIISSGSRSKV